MGPTDLKFNTYIEDHHISNEFKGEGQRSMSPRSKNVKILAFSLVLEKVVQGQGHKGQGHRSKSLVNVKDREGQGQICWEELPK